MRANLTGAARAVTIRAATPADVAVTLAFIRELAIYERLEHEVVATEADVHAALFGPRPYAEVALACLDGTAVGFALYFHTFSTFERGLDILLNAYNWIDLTPKGRDEEGLPWPMAWVRHHDKYEDEKPVQITGEKS